MKKMNVKITSIAPQEKTVVEDKAVEASNGGDKSGALPQTSAESQEKATSVQSKTAEASNGTDKSGAQPQTSAESQEKATSAQPKNSTDDGQQKSQDNVHPLHVLSRFSQLAFRLEDKYILTSHIKSVEGKDGECVISSVNLNPPHIKNLATPQIMGQPAGDLSTSCAYLLSGAPLIDLFTEIVKCAIVQNKTESADARLAQLTAVGDFPQLFRITSPFQTQRPHPVYGVRLGHFGVDFVPVRAFCDGTLRWFKASDFSTLCSRWAKKYFGVTSVEGAHCEQTTSTHGGTQLVYVLPGICRVAIAHLYAVPARSFRSSMDSGVRLKGGWSLCPPATDDVCEDFSSNDALYCMGDSGAATAPHFHCSVVVNRGLLT